MFRSPIALALWGALFAASCTKPAPARTGVEPVAPGLLGAPADPRALQPLRPLGTPSSGDPQVALGRKLFFDPRLSGDGSRSCATCHDPRKRFSDGREVALGRDPARSKRNTPALLNLESRGPYFWDGRASTLEEQALVPLADPNEMARDLSTLERELATDPEYVARFQAVFGPLGITRVTLAHAIASFERTLVSAGSRYDRYLEGDRAALTEEEVRGMRVFAGKGECTTCHGGPLLTDNGFHNIGVAGEDPGRLEAGAAPRATFKTPSLRDVARTAPYFHDGSAATLEEVIEHYARGGDPLAKGARDIHPVDLSASEKRELAAFLRSLDGAEADIALTSPSGAEP
ncbi:cytochrome-c peroxidase [Archangium sp.]|jgi:cytochrome c peroxidase|uniref:cytochrome-c peroxidase n=1 Tax=Archangium sp. TaxID=1872627 RepID=UPI002ED9999D